MHEASVKTRIPVMTLLLVTLCACQPASSPALPPAATPTPQVTIQGDNAGREEIQTIELNNCDGKGDAIRTEQRSQSVEVTISAEIAAKLGASAEVISAEVQATVGASRAKVVGRVTSIQLSAPPGTRMIFQLLWTGNEQVGVVQNLRGSNIPIAFRDFTPTDVRIKSQSDIGCPGAETGAPKPVVATPIAAPRPTTQAAAPTQPLPVICYEKCWQYDVTAQTMTWTGAADGMVDIHQDGDEVALSRMRAGWTAIIKTSVPGEIGACILILNGERVLNKCTSPDNLDLYRVPAGQVLRIQSPGPNGGFRWLPAKGYGYR